MPLYLYNGVLLRVSTGLSANENCCCNNCPGNTCCFLDSCLDLPQEYCDMLNQAVSPNCASNFTACQTCTETSCECDDVDAVNCCVDGYCVSADTEFDDGNVPTECSCKAAGGCVVTDCEDCEPDPEPCDPEDTTPLGGSGYGVMCLPDGTCIDITTEGERCLYELVGGLFTDGVACEDDPCLDVPPLNDCPPAPASCCCLVNTKIFYSVIEDGYPCPPGSVFGCNWNRSITYTSDWIVELGACSDAGSVTPFFLRSPVGCGWIVYKQLTVVTKTNVDCNDSGVCATSNVVAGFLDSNDCDIYNPQQNSYTVTSNGPC